MTQFGCFCFLFVSFIFCLCCWWSLLLLFLFLAGECLFVCFVGPVLSERLFRSDRNPHCRQGLSSRQVAFKAFRSWVPSKALHFS